MTTTLLMPSRENIPGLADKLRAAREGAQLSQQQAADRSGVHQVSIARYETDERVPTLSALYKLAEAYGVSVADLLPPPAPAPTPEPPKKPKKK